MDEDGLRRLRWRSRRGLLELDLVFDRFWAGAGARLTGDEVAALERLLRLPDNDLLDLVMGRAQAPEAGLADVLDKLRGA